MSTALTLLHLDTLIGPNIYNPQAGVFLSVAAATDCSRALQLTIKDIAQAVGLVIGPPRSSSVDLDGSRQISLFVPAADAELAADLCHAALAELDAALSGDEDFDAGEARWQLQRRRRRTTPPLRALQLIADARRRDCTARMLPDGSLLLGSGRRALPISAERLSAEPPVSPDWATIGDVPLIIVSGADRHSAALRVSAELQLPLLGDPPAAALQATLADSSCVGLVVTLPTHRLLQQGLPVNFCTAAVVTDADQPCPPAMAPAAWLDAVGLPVLVSRGPVRIGRDPLLQRLLSFAAAGGEQWPPPAGQACFPPPTPVY